MRMRWLGIAGAALLLTALLISTAGPRLWPAAYWGRAFGMLPGSGMMHSSGMMPGMGMMPGGMMTGEVGGALVQPFDLRFLDQMILHHQGAILSAQTMIADSERGQLRDLAGRIISGQQREITQMRQWRQDWYPNLPATAMPGMMGSGMMNRDQMRQMMGSNADIDRMFLQMMIPHHQAAIRMAEQALAQAQHPELKTLAQNIITTQRTEIEEMRGYLREWYGE